MNVDTPKERKNREKSGEQKKEENNMRQMDATTRRENTKKQKKKQNKTKTKCKNEKKKIAKGIGRKERISVSKERGVKTSVLRILCLEPRISCSKHHFLLSFLLWAAAPDQRGQWLKEPPRKKSLFQASFCFSAILGAATLEQRSWWPIKWKGMSFLF